MQLLEYNRELSSVPPQQLKAGCNGYDLSGQEGMLSGVQEQTVAVHS